MNMDHSLDSIPLTSPSRRQSARKVADYLDKFVREIASGRRLNGTTRYTPGSVAAWRSFRTLFLRFDPERKLEWRKISRRTSSRFVRFLSRAGYMPTTINKYLISFRALVGYAYYDGEHVNQAALRYFPKLRVAPSDKAAEIYLTAGELEALAELPLEGLQERVRDLFLVGCYLCQRVSDYSSITPDSFTTTPRGTPILYLRQRKTGNEVKIPVVNPRLQAICLKYRYNLPRVAPTLLGRILREVMRRLSERVASLREEVPTRLTMRQRRKRGEDRSTTAVISRPRWECVTTHTARRTGITHLYLSHRYSLLQMMHISGHKTPRTFLDYIKLSSDEMADEIAEVMESEYRQ